MSFIFDSLSVPVWLLLFIIGSAFPLWIKWYKLFHKKYIATGILQKKFRRTKKSTEEMKEEVFQKATDYWNTTSETIPFSQSEVKKRKKEKKSIDPVKKNNIRAVLQALANGGDTGILIHSVSDSTGISSVDVKHAISYLIEKEYVEEVVGVQSTKYYLTELGKKYCKNKNYIS